jgi:uncharacterized membrane protein required for colicin V production
MSLASNLIIGCVLVFGLINGFRHGGLKEGVALVGVLLGALLVEFWVEPWGRTLSERSGLKIDNARWVIALSILIGTALFTGYGSGIFVRRSSLKTRERLSGALLGLLNMGLLVSFTLRYTQQFYFIEADPAQPQASWIREGALSSRMVDWVGYMLIGAALTIGFVALILRSMWLARVATQQPQPAKSDKPAEKKQAPSGGAGARPAGGSGGGAVIGGAAGGSGQAGAAPPKTVPVGQQEKYIDSPPKSGS